MSITRRLFLRNTAAASAAVAAASVPATAEAAQCQSPRDRLDAAIAELKAAANAIWPDADDWMVNIGATSSIPVLISNYDASASRASLKVYVDDGSPSLADDVTGTTAMADWEAKQRRARS